MTAHPLRRILSLHFTLVAIVPFLLVAILGICLVLPQIRSDIESNQRELARAVAAQIESYLLSAMSDVRAVASLPLNDSPHRVVQGILDADIEASTSLNLIYAVLPGGRVKAVGIGPRHSDGKHRDLQGIDLSRNPIYREALRLKQPVWSDTFLSIMGSGLSVAVAVPTEHMVTIGEIDLGKLTRFLKRTAAKEGQQVLVLDSRGQVIADPSGSYTAQQLNLGNIPLIKKGLASSEPLTGRFQFNGRTMIGSIIKSPAVKWDVLVAQPAEVAFRSALTTLGIIAAGLAAALLLGIGASLYLARRLSHRVEDLASHARRIARGEEAAEWPKGHVTEIEQLADDLQLMARAIRNRERQVLESERLLRSVMDNAFQYQGLLTPDGIVVEINKTALSLVGASKESVLGRPFWDTPCWNFDAASQRQLRAAVVDCASGQLVRFQSAHPDSAGRLHHVDVSLNPMSDDAGSVIYLIYEARDITEIELAKQALKASESRLQLYFQRLPIASIVWGKDRRVRQWNPTAERVFGYSAAEAVGKTAEELILPRHAALDHEHLWHRLLDENLEAVSVSENTTKYGKQITCSWTNTPDHDARGEISGVISVAEEITERKRTENLLRESEQRFRLMFEDHKAVMLLIEPATGAIIDANNSAAAFYGYPRSELRAKNVTEICCRTAEGIAEELERAAQGSKELLVFQHRLAGGELRSVEVYCSRIDILGRQVLFAIVHDISERIAMESELLKLSRAVEQSPVSIIVTDLSGNIEYVNPRFTRMTGYSPEEAKGLNPRILKTVLAPPEQYRDLWEAVTGGEIWEGEFCNRKKNGQIYWEAATVAPILGAEGEITHFVAVKEDITEKKRASEELLLNKTSFQNLYELSLMGDQPTERLLGFSLKAALQITGSGTGYIYFMNAEETVLTLQAWSDTETGTETETGTGTRQCGGATKRTICHVQEAGLWGEAVRRRAPVIVNDCEATGTAKLGYPKGHPPIRRHMNIPLIDNGKIILVAGVGNKKEEYDETDVLQLTLLMTAMWRLVQEKQAETSLQESERNYRLLFDNMTAGFALHEMIKDEAGRPVDYRFLRVNPAFEKLTGVPASSLIGRTVKEVMPQTETYWIETFGKVARSGEPIAYQNYAGEIGKHFDSWAFSPRENQFAVIFTDVTERQEAVEALGESEDRFRQMFSQNDDAIILIHLKTLRIMDANPAALELYGVTHKELPALQPTTFFDKVDLLRIMKAIPKSGHSDGFILQKAVSFRPDGEKILVSFKAKIIHLRDEEVVLCSIRDIRGKVRLEEEVRATQAKLIHTNKMTSLGMLVSSVAHEVNNPNHCISINNTVLLNIWRDVAPHLQRVREAGGEYRLGGLPYEEIGELVPKLHAGIADSSRRIGNIVKEMKDFVKPEKATMQGVIEMNKAIESSASILWHHIQKHTDCYCMDLAETLPPIRGSRQQIEQVVINLIMNALQSLPDKTRGVFVRTAHDPEANSVSITVRDEGVGMSHDVLSRLTEPFFTKRIDKGGTGLGLYISSSIIREHQGVLEFASEPGRGTTATIRLPAALGS